MGSTLTYLVYHVIFGTKRREPIIIPEIRDDLYRYMGGIIKGEDATLLQIGGMPDHVHLVIQLKPIHTLSGLMQKLKGSSSKWMNKEKSLLGRFSWQDGYGAFTVSESQIPAVIHYVKEQESHHKKITFSDEYILFLQRHNIDYDEQYLWTSVERRPFRTKYCRFSTGD